MSTNSILSGIAKDCSNMGASIGANKDLILINYTDFNKPLTLSALNRQINDDFNNKGGLTDIKLFEGAKQYVFEGTDYSVVPSVSNETKEDGNTWYSHSISFTVYNKSSEARQTLLNLGKARVIAVTRDRSTGLYELFGAEQGLKLSGLDRPYSGSQSSNFYTVTIATPDIAVIKERSIGELSLKLNGVGGGDGEVVPPNDNLEYLLSLKEDKANKGIAGGYAPLDANKLVPAQNLPIVNDLTTGGITSILSAEQGKLLNDKVEFGLNNIRREILITLEAPITRLKASEAINSLPSFEILDNEIAYFVTTTDENEAGYRVTVIGLGKGVYGAGGTAISSTQVRIESLVTGDLAGINEVLGTGNFAIDKELLFTQQGNEGLFTKISQNDIRFNDGANVSSLSPFLLNFSNAFGNSGLMPASKTTVSDTLNRLPAKDGTLAVSVNGVFADENGNILISSTGGELPSWQQTLNVEEANVLVPYMRVTNNDQESTFALNRQGELIAFEVKTSQRISLDAGVNGSIGLGKDLGILIDGKGKRVEIKGDSAEGMTINGGASGGILFNQSTGITFDARNQGLTLLGQTKGIVINSGARLAITGGLMSVGSLSEFAQKLTVKNTTGITINTNAGNFETSIKSDLITKDGLLFQLPNKDEARVYTLATTEDIGTPTLDNVLANGSTGTDKSITLNSETNLNTYFESRFNGFTLFDNSAGVTRKSILSADSFVYENNGIGTRQMLLSEGIRSESVLLNTYTQLTPNGIVFKNTDNINSITLRGTNIFGASKLLQLPNANGVLVSSVNGYTADSNGNIIMPRAGAQTISEVLATGDDADGLSILNISDIEVLQSLSFKSDNGSTSISRDESATVNNSFVLPNTVGSNVLAVSVNGILADSLGNVALPITSFLDGENLKVTITPDVVNFEPLSNTLKGFIQGIDVALSLKEDKANKGIAGGYAGLDENGKVPLNQINDSLLGQVQYKGLYNGSVISSSPDVNLNGKPLPTPVPSNSGWYFIANAPFTYGGKTYANGDWIISNGILWDRVENTDTVSSVFGRVGHIVALSGDYNTGLVIEAVNKRYQTDNQRLFNDATSSIQTQLNSKQPLLTNPITGVVSTNYIPKSNGSGLVNSVISETGGNVSIAGSTAIAGNFSVESGFQDNLPTPASAGAFLKGVDVGTAFGQLGAENGYAAWMQSMRRDGTTFGLSINPKGGGISIGTTFTQADTPLLIKQQNNSNTSISMLNRNSSRRWGLVVDTDAVDDGRFGIVDQTNGVFAIKFLPNNGATIDKSLRIGGDGGVNSNNTKLFINNPNGKQWAISSGQNTVDETPFCIYNWTDSQTVPVVKIDPNGTIYVGEIQATTFRGDLAGTANRATTSDTLIDYLYGNRIYWGWTGAQLTAKINGTDLGANLPFNITGNAQSATQWGGQSYAGNEQGDAITYLMSYSTTSGVWKPTSSGLIKTFLGISGFNPANYLPLTGGNLSGSLNIGGAQYLAFSNGGNTALLSPSVHLDGGSSADFNTYVYGQNPYGIWTNGVKRFEINGVGGGSLYGTLGVTGIVSSGTNVATPLLTLQGGGAPYLRFMSDSGVRRAYIQHDGGNLAINTDVGAVSIGSDTNVNGLLTAKGRISIKDANPYLEFINNSGTQVGYIQQTTAGMLLESYTGGITLNKATSVNGTITASGGFFNSDERLKDVIKRDGDVAYFKWKDKRDEKVHIGYIAQEVQKTNPDQVQEDKDGILSVNYVEILVQKISEMEKEMSAMRKEIQQMKGGKHGI